MKAGVPAGRRIMKRGVLVLAVITAAATVFAQMGDEMGPRPGDGPGGEMRGPGREGPRPMGPGNEGGEGQQEDMMMRILANAKMAERIGLSQEQVTELKKAFYDMKVKQIDLRAEMEKWTNVIRQADIRID